jgi:hypothetical protein
MDEIRDVGILLKESYASYDDETMGPHDKEVRHFKFC